MRKAHAGTIIQMRQSGASLQQIADRLGISRERVRQLLVRHCGSTRVDAYLLGMTELARGVGCSTSYIRKLRRRGITRPAKIVGKKKTLWKPETVDTILTYMASHRCPICNGTVPGNRQSYCSWTCLAEARRHRYMKMTDHEKKLHNKKVARWEKSHPAEAEIMQRKQKKYWAKKSIDRI